MEIKVVAGAIQALGAEMVVVNLFQGTQQPGGATAAVDQALDGAISAVIAAGDFKGKLGETLLLYSQGAMPARRVLVVGLGERDKFTLDSARQAAAAVAQRAGPVGVTRLASIVHGAGAGGLDRRAATQALVEGAILGGYRFKGYQAVNPDQPAPIEELTLVEYDASALEEVRQGAQAGQIVAEAVCLARDLANEPANRLTPSLLAERAQQVAAEVGLACRVLGEPEMRQERMGALLAVAQGSREPARFIVLEHNAGRADLPTYVIVGKGITFDSGGISLKPSEGMERMKDDMSGAAIALGVLQAAARLALPLHVVGLLPATENLPDGLAYKPGDVLVSRAGLTIEVISTDAEGRLILADALDYAKGFAPKAVVDLATLTGACVVALGAVTSGLMGNVPELVSALEQAAQQAGERVWQLPLLDEYHEQIKSDVADIKNSGGRPAGAITAGAFLSRFAADMPWAHLDIAGTAWAESAKGAVAKGATGCCVRLLVQWLRNLAN
jgi:leucyl aminopeptidase